MKKTHGPAFKRAQIELAQCGTCQGRSFVKPMFYELGCPDCHASGWVRADVGEALTLEELVTQLSMRLRSTTAELARARQPIGGPHQQYEQNNRRGAGGSNYTGD